MTRYHCNNYKSSSLWQYHVIQVSVNSLKVEYQYLVSAWVIVTTSNDSTSGMIPGVSDESLMAIFKQQDPCIFLINYNLNISIIIFPHIDNNLQDTIVPFRKDFSLAVSSLNTAN